MISRLLFLQAFLGLGLGSVFLLPKKIQVQPAGIVSTLPDMVNDWQGGDAPVAQAERDSLGPDTEFSRKLYSKGTDQIFVSVVRSGPDMNTSIHRPERCLPAQGWTIARSEIIPITVENGGLRVTRLHNMRNVPLENNRSLTVKGLNYYWFVGQSITTPSH